MIESNSLFKDMYVNLAVERLEDMQAKGTEKEERARVTLLAAYDTLPCAPCFDKVDRKQFFEIQARAKGQRKPKKQPDTSVLQRFKAIGDAPPPEELEALQETPEENQENEG